MAAQSVTGRRLIKRQPMPANVAPKPLEWTLPAMLSPKSLSFLLLCGAALALAGCGGDKPVAAAPGPAAPTERSIFVSTVDCEASGRFPIEQCSNAIAGAVTMHDKYAPSYKSLGTCEETEGAGKCERMADRIYKPQLAAFIFDNATPPSATPLYLIVDGTPGFRTGDKKMMLGKDDNLIFSKSARDAYELHIIQ